MVWVLQVSENHDPKSNTKKTEVVYQPVPGETYREASTTVNGQSLRVVDKFTYCKFTIIRKNFIFADYREFERSGIQHSREMFGYIEVT